MAFLTDLDEVLRERGVKVQTHPGWKTRGYNGWSFAAVRGVLWHHTATNRAAFANNPAPTVPLCRDGRSDLPGPLCQIVLDRNGVAHIIAAGWGNHAGPGSYKGIPTDQGNQYLIGIEMESSGIPPYDWTLAQLQAIPVLRDALRDGYGHSLDIGHMEWSSQGKIDPAGLPGGMNWLRTATARTVATAASVTKPKEDTLSAAEVKQIIDHIDKKFEEAPSKNWGYKRTGDKRDASQRLVDLPKDAAYRVVREPVKNKDGKPYQVAAYLINDNANIWALASQMRTVLDALSSLANAETTPAQEIVNQMREKLAGLKFELTPVEESPAEEEAPTEEGA